MERYHHRTLRETAALRSHKHVNQEVANRFHVLILLKGPPELVNDRITTFAVIKVSEREGADLQKPKRLNNVVTAMPHCFQNINILKTSSFETSWIRKRD